MEQTGEVELGRMTSPEAATALARAEVAIIPVGATEQHGPNLTLETDTTIAHRLSVLLARRLYPCAVVVPPVPFGVSHHHLGFAGTLTVAPETFIAIVLDLVRSLRHHGIRRFFIIDGHAGNQGVLEVLMTKLRFELGVQAAYLFYFTLASDVIERGVCSQRWGHACEVETSVALALEPGLVRQQTLAAGELHPPSMPFVDPWRAPRLGVPQAFEEITGNGALGDARQASPEFGQAIVDRVIERAQTFLEAFLRQPV
ncbi:creatininase family protein [Thermomicrobiaceae bacterium CFH 74404]|uniref:Creatininase family protein n=1 Tax=Thermalbibacter longus TaxID=2951981 RepID=A0AA41W9J1_9BACT|nr:creatininase family protein [Thermalbibacter longus]MCM8747717.1 creatininase family protein [Thermalbibacter longus]